jgi:hypothetical protein
MSRQVFKQTNGMFSIYSNITDTFIVTDVSKHDLIENMAAEAADEAACETRHKYKKLVEMAENGHIPFLGVTWEEAVENHKKNTES